MEKQNVKILFSLFASTLLFLGLSVQTAYAETLEENLNNLVGPKVQYNTMLSPVYLKSNTVEEYINPQSGCLKLAQTDYVLPGRSGLDLEIKRLYSSDFSNVKEMKTQYYFGAWVDTVYSDANTSSFIEDRYNLGIGMRFSFPSLEIKKNNDGTTHIFLHSESGDVYRLKQKNTQDGIKTYLPENQTIEDVEITEDPGFSNGQSDGTSKFKMVGKDGKKTYFSEDGRVLGIIDRYGNTIKFEYITQSYAIDGVSKTKRLISKITDSVGRIVTISYNEDYSFKVTPIKNQKYSIENSYTASQNPNMHDSGDLEGKFQVVVTLPDGKKIIYDKTAALVSIFKQVIRTRLQRVYDIDGKVKYHFWYEQPELGFTFMNGVNYTAFNRYENLTQVDYCKENRLVQYTYSMFTRKLNGNSGSIQYRKIIEKKELAKTGFDDTKTNFTDKFQTELKAYESYKCINEADGFGTSGYKEDDKDYLKDSFRYYTEKTVFIENTDKKSVKTKYTYNGIHETIELIEEGSDHRKTTVTEYDEMKFPKMVQVTMTNIVNGKVSGNPLVKTENFRYDKCGNLTNYVGPLAKRDEKGYPAEDDPHMVVYTYDYERYHVLTLKTWRQDEDTICQTRFIPDEKGNIIREEKLYAGNELDYVITDYKYDNYGNIIQKIVYSPEQDYETWYEYGIDLNGVDQKGIFLTKEYYKLDGVEIAYRYAYDPNTGNIFIKTDGKGNRTEYEYDVLGRLTKVINPDGTYKQYTYIESHLANTQLEYVDAQGFKRLYEYDTLGRQIEESLYDKEAWRTCVSTEYDFRGNKIKETDANGHSVRFTYDSADRLIKKEFYENDTVRKENITLSYAFSSGEDTSTIVTQKDEAGYIQKFHYDILNRLSKHEISPVKDNSVFYATAYAYDYIGNMVAVTDAEGNTTCYEYDNLGRLVKKKDALNNETCYFYNSLDKLTLAEEPDGRVNRQIYDALGRIIEERTFDKGYNDYIYTRYSYDKAGNLEVKKQGNVVSGIDTPSFEVSINYNSMNLPVDTYQKLDGTRVRHTHYVYDGNGNQTEVVEYVNKEEDQYIHSLFEYDHTGNVIKEEGYLYFENNRQGYFSISYVRDYAGNVLFENRLNHGIQETTSYVYDHRNRLKSKTEPYKDGKNKTVHYEYDEKGNMISETVTRVVNGQEVNSTTTYTYDGTGKMLTKANALGYATTYVYDKNGNLIKEIDPRYFGKPINVAPSLEHEYDALNRLVKTIAFDGTTRRVILYKEYDGRGNVVLEANGEGYNPSNPSASIGSRYQYDTANCVIMYSSAQASFNGGHSKKFVYDGSGRVIKEEDGNNNITRYSYYLDGNLKEAAFADGSFERYEYDLTSKVFAVKYDRNGNRTAYFLNVFGKPFRIEYPNGTAETFEYDNKGNVLVSRDKAGNPTYFEYDASGNMLSKKEYVLSDDSFDYYKQTVYSFDQANSMLSQETFQLKISKQDGTQKHALPMNDGVDYFYDKAGRQIKVQGPGGRETRNTYDTAGNLVLKEERVTEEGEFDATGYTYDTQSRVLTKEIFVKTEDIDLSAVSRIILGEGAYSSRIRSVTAYEYYTDNQIKSIKDPAGNLTKYEYDYDGRLIKKTDPFNNSTIYIYDVMGNLIEQKDEKGVSVYFEYNSVNRLIRKRTPSSDGEYAVIRYLYDPMGNLIKEISPNQYDASMDTSASANGMPGMSYTYDTMSRRTSAVSPEGRILEVIAYDSKGNVVKTVDGLKYTGDINTSQGTVFEYDGLGRVIKQIDALSNSTIYTYDVLGRLLKQTDARGNSTDYEYNSDGTFRKVRYADDGNIEYAYDRLGRKIWEKDQRGNETRYAYNAFGKLKSQTDAYGKTVVNKYDLNGNLVYQKDKRGSITYFTYDANNRLTEMRTQLSRDASGNFIYAQEKYAYDERGNVIKKTLTGTKDKTSRRETYYTYYDNGLVKTVSDSVGAYQKSYYDKNDNLVKLEIMRDDDDYDILKYHYDTMDRMIRSIKLVDREAIFNADGLPDAYLLADAEYPNKICLITGYEYDILGNKTKEIEARGYGDMDYQDEYTVSYGYDELNRLNTTSRIVNGNTVTVSYYYDEVGNMIRENDERGFEKTYSYDSMNRLILMADVLNNPFTYSYDKAGNKISETNALGYSMTYTYDKLNRLETVTDPYGIVVITNEYDDNGNIIKETDAKGNSELYTYDLANRLVRVTDREGGETAYEYNQYGEKIRETDGLGNETSYEYDDGGRLVKVIDASKVSTRYTWDKAGNKLTMTDGRGKVTTYTYGGFGLLTSVTDACRKTTANQYDLAGNVEFMIDRNGAHTLYSYDNRNLLLSKEVLESGDSVGYSYDESGNRISMTDDSGTSRYIYDGNNQLLKIEKDGIAQISYTYDRIGNILTVTDSKGFVTAYTYDKSSRMETVSFGGRTIVYSYDVNGNRESLTCDGSFTENYTYDKNNRVTGVYNRNPGGSIISQYTYTYDKAGRQISKTDSYGTTKYTYDKVGRVIKVEMPGKTTVYTYDLGGNRASQSETYTSAQLTGFIDTDSGKAVEYIIKKSDYVYSDTNRLLKLVERMYDDKNQEVLRKTVQYYYDENGNNLSETASYMHPHNYNLRQATKGSIYSEDMQNPIDPLIERVNNTFDGFNRLKSVESVNGGTRTLTEYTYDGNDLRVEKTVSSSDNAYIPERTSFLYDRQHVVLETDGTNNVKMRYVRGINYIAQYNGSDISYYLYNGHGDTVQTVAENGEVQNQYDYDIFGNPTLAIEIFACSIRYAGEYLDNETGLYYLRARYYDPYIGRFISEDSYWGEDTNPLSLNLYTYCSNNPIRYIDPTGHTQWDIDHLSAADYAKLEDIWAKYAVAKTPEERTKLHLEAEAIREPYRQGTKFVGSADGHTYVAKETSSGTQYDLYDKDVKHLNTKTKTSEAAGLPLDVHDPRKSGNTIYTDKYVKPTNDITTETSAAEKQHSLTNEEIDLFVEALEKSITETIIETYQKNQPNYEQVADIFKAFMIGQSINNYYFSQAFVEQFFSTAQWAAQQDLINEYESGIANNTVINLPYAEGTSKTVTYSPANPGPLKQSVAETFSGATYKETVLTQDTTFYRVYGGSSGKVGSYMTRVPQNGGMQSQVDLALNPQWGNTAQYVTKVTVPKGTVIYEGTAAPQVINGGAGQLIGGGNQVYIPEVDASWFK